MVFKFFLALLVFSNLIYSNVAATFNTVDKIIAEVYTTEGKSIITQSDLRPGIDGTPKEIKDVVLQKLILLDGKKLKLIKSEDDPEYDAEVNNHIAKLKKQNNLTDEDISRIFQEGGYSDEEGRNELRNMKIIDTVLDHRVRGKIFVEKKELEDFYKDHPKISPPTYKISQTTIPYDSRAVKEEQLKKIENNIKNGDIIKTINWPEPFELNESDIAEEKSFIKNLPVGSVTIIENNQEGIKLLRIVDKTPEKVLPIENAIDEIRNELYVDKFQKALKKYYDEIINNAKVRYIS